MNLSIGVAARVSRTFCAFLNVTIPVKLTSDPMATIRCIADASFAKQWNTPRTRPANFSIIEIVSSNASR